MGLLDDAIREHLDLKRRRGADPEEITRLEREALGPVRREAAVAPPSEQAVGVSDDPLDSHFRDEELAKPRVAHTDESTQMHEVLADEHTGSEVSDEPAAPRKRGFLSRRRQQPEPQELSDPTAEPLDHTEFEDEEEIAPPLALDAPPQRPSFPITPPEPSVAEPDVADELEADDPQLHARDSEPDEEPDSWVEDETQLFDVPGHLASEEEAEPEPSGEDVLEETPDFLQDTPDHDRLWFEQKPPRDFDFDG